MIGRQSAHTAQHSPTRGEDAQFRHAFLIMEPKKKDPNTHTKHVLCAESDHERDEWVSALLQYVGMPAPDKTKRSGGSRNGSSTKGTAPLPVKKSSKDETADSAVSDPFASLQGTSYENTSQLAPPTTNIADALTPVRNTFQPSQAELRAQIQAQAAQAQANSAMISAPRNGGVIQDAVAWGNKIPDSPKSKEKEQKKRSMWGFRDKLANIGDTNHSTTSLVSHPAIRPVFGIPLTEAVEFCMAPGSNVCLPSVVFRCIEYLEAKDAANEEGIFRLSGSNLVIKHLKEKFNTEGDFNFLADDTYYDVHAVASLLKLYLRELPSMVLTRDLHVDFLQAMGTFSFQMVRLLLT